jgi:NAD(P)-dependent dehydrogenase (short-subunit alcohol dehydrogenase family)
MRLRDKSVFISGAGGGIGRDAAQMFASEGAAVTVADRDFAAAEEVAGMIGKAGGRALALRLDVTQEESVKAAIAAAVGSFGRLDVLYNNVGGSSPADGPVTEAPIEEFHRCMNVDLFGTWLCCRYGVRELIKSGGGSVINMSSVLALVGTKGKHAYTAAKGAISALTRAMAVEYAPHKIRVNAIAPGITLTPRVERLLETDGVTSGLTAGYLLGLVAPRDVASLALYLASDESRVTTGQVISVDSGVSIS